MGKVQAVGLLNPSRLLNYADLSQILPNEAW